MIRYWNHKICHPLSLLKLEMGLYGTFVINYAVLVNYVPLSQHCWHATMTAGMKIVLTVAIRWKSNPKGTTPLRHTISSLWWQCHRSGWAYTQWWGGHLLESVIISSVFMPVLVVFTLILGICAHFCADFSEAKILLALMEGWRYRIGWSPV